MATVESLVTAVMAAVNTEIMEVDESSATTFLPAVSTQSIAMIAVPFGHTDEARDFSFGEIETVHRLRLQFWVKLVGGGESTAIPMARAIGYRAMQAIAEHDGEGYTLGVGDAGSMENVVADAIQDVNGQAYLLSTLTVPVVQVEVV